jgi:tetratricopeptide (TPR) repeat protein
MLVAMERRRIGEWIREPGNLKVGAADVSTGGTRPTPRRTGASRARSVSLFRLPRLDVSRILAGLFVLLVVCSLAIGTVGTAFLDFGNSKSDDENVFSLDDPKIGEFEQTLRDQVAKNPDDLTAIRNLANLLATMRKSDEAIDWYERAVELAPDDLRLRLDFGGALIDAGRFLDAEVQIQKARTIDPQNAEVEFGLGELYRKWTPPRISEALAAYQRTVALAPDDVYGKLAAAELERLGGADSTSVASPGGVAEA